MANHKSAEKAYRQTLVRTERNRAGKSRLRTFVRKVEESLEAADHKVAHLAARIAESELMKAASKGLIHKNKASRKASRLAKAVKKISAAS